jgi:hypothetical protein
MGPAELPEAGPEDTKDESSLQPLMVANSELLLHALDGCPAL